MKVIAETAFNHNGDYQNLLDLLSACAECQPDYATVQIFDAPSFCEKEYERYDIYKKTSFTQEQWKKVFDLCESRSLKLIPCPLDLSSLVFCYDNNFRLIKLHATDMLNLEMLDFISGKKDIKILLETQCATKIDIDFCLSKICDQVECLFHGFSDYPTELDHIRLNSLDYLKNQYGKKIGLADHTLDIAEMPLMCLAKGVDYLEKHITLSRSSRGYDWQVSLEPEDFKQMLSKIRKYSTCLGKFEKHPSNREGSYRNVMYKKYLNESFIRSDRGTDYLTHMFDSFEKEKTGIALIARLKSQRLKKKVLLPLKEKEMIVDLYRSLESSGLPCYLATSDLAEDSPLVDLSMENDMDFYQGDPVSVLDRILKLSLENKWGAVFRVTGDNPFTNIELIKRMKEIMVQEDLDYVRVNGVPFGVSAELFSTSYLWDLYKNLETTSETEYLSWFILNDDSCKKGCINILGNDEWKYTNYSVDYKEDYDRCISVCNKITQKRLQDYTLEDLLQHTDFAGIDREKEVKLPQNIKYTLEEYLDLIDKVKYSFIQNIYVSADSLIREIESGCGYIIVNNITYENYLELADKIGIQQIQNNKGDKIISVKDKGRPMSSGGRYHQGRDGGSIHTDCPHWEDIADYVSLFCEEESFEGGETLLSFGKEIYKEMLHKHPKHVIILKECFYFDRKEYKEGEPKTISKPVLFENNNNICFRYLRDYIESGYKLENKKMSKQQVDALDALDQIIKDKQIKLKLKKNDAIFFNNLNLLHGRTAFTNNIEFTRSLKRMWLCKH